MVLINCILYRWSCILYGWPCLLNFKISILSNLYISNSQNVKFDCLQLIRKLVTIVSKTLSTAARIINAKFLIFLIQVNSPPPPPYPLLINQNPSPFPPSTQTSALTFTVKDIIYSLSPPPTFTLLHSLAPVDYPVIMC